MNRETTKTRPAQLGSVILVLGIIAFAWSILLFAHPNLIAQQAGRSISALGWAVPVTGLVALCIAMAAFTREVLASPSSGAQPELTSARTAVLLFIFSETALFGGLFATYFYFAFGSSALEWPPIGLEEPQPWGLPLFGTILLLCSGAAAVTAHHLFLSAHWRASEIALIVAIALGAVFLVLQVREFARSSFSFQDGAYPSVFFLTTGLHGAHVLVGITLLAIAALRLRAGHFTGESHFGLEAPIWYWHFVDVVWVLLFAVFYVAWT